MAAYAALVSLMNTVDAIQNHHRLFTSLDKYQTQSLKERLDSLLQFVEECDFRGGMAKEAVEDLKSQIGSAAHAAEVVIEGHVVDRVISELLLICPQKMIEGMEMVMHSLYKEGHISKWAVEYLTAQIGSAVHATGFFILDSKRIRLDSTQGITEEAAEDLMTGIKVVDSLIKIFLKLNGSEQMSRKDLHKIIEDIGPMKKDMGSLMKKVNYVKERLEHEQQSLDLQKIIDDMGSLMERVNNVKELLEHEYQKPTDSMPTAASSRSYSAGGKTSMVGFDGHMYELKDRLTGDRPNWQVIPITGMGGIGKTTLARNVYDDSLIVQHFDKRAWVTVSQEYSVRKILVEILSSVEGSTRGLDDKSEDILGGKLHKILFDRRYLIILDDVWSIDAWEKLQSFFPKQEQGSRIVVTTRHSDMAEYFGTSALIMNFLDVDKSWELFCKKVFAHDVYPPELEGIGRKIVKKCGGLPLSIAVIGGVLGKSPRVQKYWENVEKNMSSIVNSAEENLCSDVLSLSYNHLPAPLKSCFLYLGIYPKDTKIRVTKLVRCWVAEGFLKSNKDQSLEEVGEAYVKDLEDRNFIVVQQEYPYSGKTFKSFKVHDLLRELCIRTAKKEKFFCVMSRLDSSRHVEREGRSAFHKIIRQDQDNPQVLSLSIRGETQHQNCELWRVMINHDFDFRKPTCQQVSLRYWEHDAWLGDMSPSPLLSFQTWNLQTCMDRSEKSFSSFDIWEMTHLRHVQFRRVRLPDPPSGNNHDRIVLENLQTLGTVRNFKCSEEVCERMPNIKKLSIEYFVSMFEVISWSTLLSNVSRFNKLESLKYKFYLTPNRDELLQNLKFPNSLKKLRLSNCGLHWDDLTIIGSLPHLEVLRLDEGAIQGPEWNPIENQFRRLKFLRVDIRNLINWNADSSHFPNLEKLILYWGVQLEIPEGIGGITTLRVISLLRCSASVAISALKILKAQQEEYENYDINVFVHPGEGEIEVREWMERECITTYNVHFVPFLSHPGEDEIEEREWMERECITTYNCAQLGTL